MKIVVITAGLSEPSSTRLLADQLAEAAVRELELRGEVTQVEVVELRRLAHALADRLTSGFGSTELEAAIASVRTADALIAVTPVFSASYSGLFKTFFDVLEPETLVGMPVQIAATAGTARHSLVLDHALRPLFAYLRAMVLPTGVFAATEDFGGPGTTALAARVARAGAELADHLAGATRREPARDEFAEPVPFERLLRGI
ncbi:FMN reductase [Nocardioides daejeonensis]|uniref:FMN reductase n=1 Tax=Nocardioides daejeonensis TaxID=1046556 RepID=UPI000D74EB7B|nr:FMN reductase [Nocardioides daejeonensis]